MKQTNHLKIFVSLGVVLAILSGCSKSAAEKVSVEGRWTGYDQARPAEQITLELRAGHFTYWDAQTNQLGAGTYVVKGTGQPPQMDLTFVESMNPKYVGKVGLAIYQLQANELRIAGSEPGNTVRPADIAPSQDVIAFTFKRE